jgi:alpha-1,3-rhamnosyl/mannosyltransferase
VVPLLTDLSAVSKPRWHDCSETRQLERFLSQINQYPMITTVSDFTRGEIANLAGIDPRRIAVIPPGVDALFYAAPRAEDEFELQAIGLLPRQFFLYVGLVDEQANLSTLLQAYAALPERVKAWLPFVLAGGRGRGAMGVPHSAQHDLDCGNIRFLGRVPQFLLRLLYCHARLTLFPSTNGGFGLALAEALACGAPVAVSRGSALADMAGPLALQVEAENVLQWRDILSDQVDRGAHAPGVVHGTMFSWDRAAEQAMQVYEHIAGERRAAA